MRVGIVGARVHGRPDSVRALVRTLPRDAVVVSGGAPDVDTWAEEEARAVGLAVDVKRPAAMTREALLARDAEIAETVDALHAFPWIGARGTYYTMRLARRRGIEVVEHPIEPACQVLTARWGIRNEPDIFNIMRGWAERHPPAGAWTRHRPEKRLRMSIAWARQLMATTGASLLQVQYEANKEGVGSLGEPWAPSVGILRPALGERRRLEKIDAEIARIRMGWKDLAIGDEPPPREEERVLALRAESEAIGGSLWSAYTAAYREEMRQSYQHKAIAWGWLLTLPRVVLSCRCEDPARCHRSLAAAYLGKLGATIGGEVGRT